MAFIRNITIFLVTSALLFGVRAQSAEITIFDSADSTLSQTFSQSDAILGDAQYLDIGGITSFGGSADSLIRFDLSAIPAGATITAAKLLFNEYGTCTNGNINTGIDALFSPAAQTPSWDDTAVTWNNAPARGATLFDVPIGTEAIDGRTIEYSSPALLNWVVTAKANPAVANAGWRVYCVSNGNQGVRIYSKKATYSFFAPRLIVSYTGGAAPSDRLSLSNLTLNSSGSPICEQANGQIGVSCRAGDAVNFYYPRAISGDFTATCWFSAVLPRVWMQTPQAAVGLFLRPGAPDGKVYPDANKIVYTGLNTKWSDSGAYWISSAVNGAAWSTDSCKCIYLQQKKLYEFYIRLTKQGAKCTFYFSRNGYCWTTMASNAVPESYTAPYLGFCLSVPPGGVRSSIILEGFEVVQN